MQYQSIDVNDMHVLMHYQVSIQRPRLHYGDYAAGRGVVLRASIARRPAQQPTAKRRR